MRTAHVGLGLALSALLVGLVPAACVGEDPVAGGTPSDADGGSSDGGSPADVGCSKDGDCPALATTPAGCATAKCDLATSRCTYVATDSDKDGHPAHACVSQDPTVSVQTGDDCDDGDATLFPGHPRECAALSDGTAIAFPGGTPKGLCKAGTQACKADGTVEACAGAVAPVTENCATDDVDEDCDGSPVNGCPCTPVASTQACNTHGAKDGVGPCVAGSQTCEVAGWSNCSGDVGPTTDDCSPTGSDNDCDGIKGNGAGCTQTVYVYGTNGGFNCAAGQASWPSNLWITDANDTTLQPNGLTLIAQMKLFASGGATKVAVYRCYDSGGGYNYVGFSGCGGGTQNRLVGYASNVNGGNGWVQLASFYGKNFGPTGVMPVNAAACGTCCSGGSYYTLQ